MGAKQQAYKKLADTMIKNFSQRNIEAFYCDDRNQAVSLAMEMMKDGNTVGFGGSETLNEIGILDTIKNSSLTLIDRNTAKDSGEKKRDDFKRFIVYCLASIVVIAQTAVFAISGMILQRLIFEPFWRKGNWVLIAIYGLISFMFSKFYGGLRVGYLKKIDVFYSMTLAAICTNIITYLQITLINRWFLDPWPMVEMTLVQIVIIIVWVWGSRFIYSRLMAPVSFL